MVMEFGHMMPDELREARELTVLIRSIEVAPQLFTRSEVMDAYRREMELHGRIRRRLELPDGQDCNFDLTFGVVHEPTE